MRLAALLPIAVLALVATGCSQLMGGLRPDLDDEQPSYESQPTVGGAWPERGMLDDDGPPAAAAQGDRYATVGHSERAPAGVAADSSGNGWADSGSTNADERYAQQMEGDDPNQISYSNTPNLPPPVRRLYKNGNRATQEDFIDDSPNEGSLWASGGQTNYYFTKNKVRAVGDIITVKLEPDLIRDIGLEVKRTLNEQEKELELALAQERANARAAGRSSDALATSQAAPGRGPASGVESPAGPQPASASPAVVTPADVDVSQSLDLKAGDPMLAEITERYPNGNYKIRATKKVLYRNGAPRLLNMIAIVKGSDIGEDDSVASGKLYEYRLQAIR